MKHNLYVIIGRSCTGKTTITLNTIEYFKDIHECISYTTRKKRPDEIHGTHYNFVSRDRFEELVRSGQMVENITYDGNYYGLGYGSFSDEKDNIVVVEPSGLRMLQEKLSDIYNIIVVKIDESDDVIKERFMLRGDSEEDADRRMESDRIIFENVDYNYLINSDANKLIGIILETRFLSVLKEELPERFEVPNSILFEDE